MKLQDAFPHVKTFPQDSVPYPDRFQNARRLKRSDEDKDGLETILSLENGNVLLDFGEAVQCVGMTLKDAKALVNMMIEAIIVSELKEEAGVNVKATN